MKSHILSALFLFLTALCQAQTMQNFEPELYAKMADFYGQGQYDEALKSVKQWAEKAEQKFGTEDSTYALAMTWLGIVSSDMENYEAAEKAYKAALSARAKVFGVKHKSYAGALTNLAGLYLSQGQYDKAEPLFRQARQIFAETLGSEHPNYAANATNLAYLYALCGRYELAEKLHNEAIAIYAKVSGKRSAEYAVALNNLALLYQDLKEYDKEIKILEEVIDVAAEALGRTHPYYANFINNLANLYIETKHYTEAEALYRQALDIYKETVGKKHTDYARTLNNLSALYLVTRRYEEAFPLVKEAIVVWEQKLGKKHPHLARGYNNMALLLLHKNENEKAQHYINAAFSANSETELQAANISTLFDSLNQISFLSAPTAVMLCEQLVQMQDIICRQGQCSKKDYLSTVEKSLSLSDRLQQSFMTDEDRLQLLSFGLPLLSAHIHASLEVGSSGEYIEKAFRSADQNKSALMESAMNGNVSFGGLPDSLSKKEQNLKKELDLMNKELLETTDEQKRNEVQTKISNLNLEIESFKKLISEKYPKYYNFRFKSEPTDVKALQAMLPEKTMLLEYFLEDTLVYIFALTNKKVEVFRHPIKQEQLSKNCKNYRELISTYDQAANKIKPYTVVAYQLYRDLLEAALKANPESNALIIVADGELGHIPFEAFLTKDVPQPNSYATLPYLLHQYKISYSYSAKLWIENNRQKNTKKTETILAMAASYKAQEKKETESSSTRSGTLRNLRDALQELPAAKAEVESLGKHFKGDFITETSATEARFKKEAAKHGVIHLAMHGIIDIKNPILSSIAFSENGDSTEDNFLQAFEVSGLNMQANLVVLSACETGYGRFRQGEGVVSLARSFMYAGVPALVVSLWQVNDASTAMIMKAFYSNLANGMDKAEALQKAKLEYIGRCTDDGINAHPAFWAPFIQLGDSRPLKIAVKSDYSFWLWTGGAISTLILLLLLLRKKRLQ